MIEIPNLKKPYIHPLAAVIGNVHLGNNVSIWPGAVLRGDLNHIYLGDGTNIQDNSTLHTDSRSDLRIGEWTLVGHNTMLHGCKIGRACLIGIGSIVLDGAEIGDGAQITAGCLIRGGKKIPPRSLVISKNGDIQVIPNKAKPILTVAGCIEYIHLADRIQRNDFTPFPPEEEERFLIQAESILASLGIGYSE